MTETVEETIKEIQTNPVLKGLDINDFTRGGNGRFGVYGFHQTADPKATAALLTKMGFLCGPNMGFKRFGTAAGER